MKGETQAGSPKQERCRKGAPAGRGSRGRGLEGHQPGHLLERPAQHQVEEVAAESERLQGNLRESGPLKGQVWSQGARAASRAGEICVKHCFGITSPGR